MKANKKQPGLILLIDAEPSVRREHREVLEWAGFRVEEAADGREGMALARLLRPEVIFCARQIGSMRGDDLLRHLDEEWESGGAWAFIFIGEDAEDRFPFSPKREADEVLPDSVSDATLIETAHDYLDQVEEWREVERRAEEQVDEILHDWEVERPISNGEILPWEDGLELHTVAGRVHSNQILQLAKEIMAEKGRSPDLECFIDLGFVPFRMEVLREVLREILGNACRFTQSGTRVDLFYIRGSGRSVLFVRDYGDGMDTDLAVRLTAGWENDAAGQEQGQGLRTVRRLVREAGASFRVDGGKDEGVTIRIEIPEAEGIAQLPLTVPEAMGIAQRRIDLPRKHGKK